jgi:RNA polymerase sigma-70 factor (ECF subfamily)
MATTRPSTTPLSSTRVSTPPATPLCELCDEAVLERFRAGNGDEGALAELARRYEAPLLGLARGILGGREDLARDAVQETWIRVIKHARGFEGRSGFKTWLYRIAINRARDVAASRLARGVPGGAPRSLASADEAEGPKADIDDLAALHAAVAKLAEAPRLILILCYHRGLTLVQAAEVLNIPPGTLKSRLHAALNELRRSLSKEGRS